MPPDYVEPSGEQSYSDDEEHAIVMLALGVLVQAFRDLTVNSGVHNCLDCRRDAYDFLTERLWEQENLWGEILASYLIRRKIIEAVHRQILNPTSFVRPGV